MVRFLSAEWVAALDEAARRDERLAALPPDVDLVVEQVVTGTPDGDVTYHVTLGSGTATVQAGPAPSPTVRFTQDLATALDIASGRGSAQRAFMTGKLRVGGDLRVLLDHGEALAQLDDAFAAVRAQTDLTAPVA